MIASRGPASSTSKPWAPRPSASCRTFSATPPSGGSKASRTLRLGMRALARRAEVRAPLRLALPAAPAPHGVDGHEPALAHLVGVDRQAALRGGDDVETAELQSCSAHAEHE